MAEQITLKLTVAEDRHGAILKHSALAAATRRQQEQMVSVYYDTPRLALRRAGILLRLCKQGASWMQAVERQVDPLGGLGQRSVWRTPYPNHFDFSGIDDAELRKRLQRDKVTARLVAVFETKFRRTSWQIDPDPDTRVLVRLDRGWIASGGRREPISELELQLVSGEIGALYSLALDLARRQPLPPLPTSKAERGYQLFLNAPASPVKSGDVPIRANDTPLAAFRRIAVDCLTHLHQNQAGAVCGEDPEYVHQMRVAARRLRAAVRMFRPVLPAWLEEQLVPPMSALMRALGQARDLDVLMAEIVAPVAAALPDEPRLTDLTGAVTNRLYRARADIRQLLRQPAYASFLLTAAGLLHGTPFAAASAAGEQIGLLRFADRRLSRLRKRVLGLADAASVDDPSSLHQLRIGIKRLRYAIGFFGPMMPGKSGAAVTKRLARLQDELGQLNDLASAGSLLMACAGRDQHLREAVTLVGGWHGSRHAQLLADIPDRLRLIRALKVPRLAGRANPRGA